MVKKVGLTLNEDVFETICQFAHFNHCSPTEFCRLIIEHQVDFYLSTKKIPVFTLSPKLFFKNISENSVEGTSDSDEIPSPESVPDWNNLVAELMDE